MRVSKAQAQANRAHIVETAATLFRERGYDGVGVADLMAAAGFTHGGFYKHFGSKTDLMAEAAHCGFDEAAQAAAAMPAREFLAYYLSREHRDNPGQGCTMAALCGDAARQPASVKDVFAAGIEARLRASPTAGEEAGAEVDERARAQRIALIAQAVGAMVLSRSCPDDSALADELLQVCRNDVLARLDANALR